MLGSLPQPKTFLLLTSSSDGKKREGRKAKREREKGEREQSLRKRRGEMSLAEGKKAIEALTGERCATVRVHTERQKREKREEREKGITHSFVSFVQFDLGAFLKANPHVIHKLTAHLNPSVSQGDKR